MNKATLNYAAICKLKTVRGYHNRKSLAVSNGNVSAPNIEVIAACVKQNGTVEKSVITRHLHKLDTLGLTLSLGIEFIEVFIGIDHGATAKNLAVFSRDLYS